MKNSSHRTRREFHVAAGSLVLGGSMVVLLGRADAEDAEKGSENGACNFQASFMTWDVPYRKDPRPYARHNTPHGNRARIQLDALIDVIDRESKKTERFVLIAPCRTEWMYAEDRLFQIPSAEYRMIYSPTEERSVSKRITTEGGQSHGQAVKDRYRSLKIDVTRHPRTTYLETPAEIVAATSANKQLVARTRIDDPDRPVRYVLEYPIRTMNFQPKTNSFQVDTGPLLVADFSSAEQHAINRLAMAHVAYNRLDRAEFILRRPTPIKDNDGKPLCHVLHYSEVREDRAVNEILTGERV